MWMTSETFCEELAVKKAGLYMSDPVLHQKSLVFAAFIQTSTVASLHILTSQGDAGLVQRLIGLGCSGKTLPLLLPQIPWFARRAQRNLRQPLLNLCG